MAGWVTVHGLAELRRALRELDDSRALAEVRKASVDATKLVDRLAKARAVGLGGVAAHAVSTGALKARGTKLELSGLAPTEYGLGAEFGGGRKHGPGYPGKPTSSTAQFQPFLGTKGYFLYPTIREHLDEVVETYADALDKIIRRAFPG